MVFETAESLYSWKAACIRTCQAGETSWAVTKARCHFSGTPSRPRTDPWFRMI